LAAIFSAFGTVVLLAQDNHYEYMKMGSRNSVLANAGLSRFEDQAAAIINPATLSFANTSSFSFNTTSVGYSNINFENGLGQGFNLKYGTLNVLPTMAAGVLKPKKNDKDFVVGYALYHPISDRLRFTDRRISEINVINDAESPGNENYLAQFNLDHYVDEVSLVLGVGWNIGENVALGVSQTFTYRGEEYSNSFTASAIPLTQTDFDFVSYNSNIYTKYYKILTQTKVGLAMEIDKWNIGLTATLPSLGIMGTGEVMGEATLNNVHPGNDLTEPRTSYFASGRYEKQKVKYKQSISAGLGVSKLFGPMRLYGGLNYYAAIPIYDIMNPGPADFLYPNTPSNQAITADFLRIWAGNRAVLNYSLASDWIVKENRHLMISFHTDKYFTELGEEEPGHKLPVKNWNNYHVGLGTAQTIGRSDWVIGIRYSFAKRDDVKQPYSLDDPSEGNFLQGERTVGTVKASSLQLLLSYAFRFK
jgi:hypothetical protein